MDTTSEVDALREDISQLRKDFASLTENVKQAASNYVNENADTARDRLRDVGNEIQAHPFASIAAAFGVGLLLGKLFSH